MYRVGLGWDRHPLETGRACVLGGVEFSECERGPAGHSDGDAVCHAIIDALLGAAALGDIGRYFPDSDPAWAGADSTRLLARSGELLRKAGYEIGNIDCTVVIEIPRISPRVDAMKTAIATALGVTNEQVSVKATRGEGLGPEGRQECVTVLAVALVTTPVTGE
ncbi:MAG: 2-C-methyl-D-erythritol 2,4-cyclodiphosphate synthase [bacterium]